MVLRSCSILSSSFTSLGSCGMQRPPVVGTMQSKIPVQIKIIHEQHAMSELGQNRKSSMRANVFRCSPNNGSRQYECKGRRLAPLIEIGLLEWMSGILSKVRILPDD